MKLNKFLQGHHALKKKPGFKPWKPSSNHHALLQLKYHRGKGGLFYSQMQSYNGNLLFATHEGDESNNGVRTRRQRYQSWSKLQGLGKQQWRLWLRLWVDGDGGGRMGRHCVPSGLHSRWVWACVRACVCAKVQACASRKVGQCHRESYCVDLRFIHVTTVVCLLFLLPWNAEHLVRQGPSTAQRLDVLLCTVGHATFSFLHSLVPQLAREYPSAHRSLQPAPAGRLPEPFTSCCSQPNTPWRSLLLVIFINRIYF